jgi:hypothetical protein
MKNMSFSKNNCQQISLNDRSNKLTEREKRILDKSWAKVFGDRIFPLINEEKFEILYCADNGRPNTPVNIVIGSLILKEMFGLTDGELLENILFNIQYQYALRLTNYEEIPYSDRTPSRFRERLYLYEMETGRDILKEEMEQLSGEYAKLMKIDSKLKRMDSLMVSSSCKRMGRLELMYTCVSNLVKALVKSGEEIPEHLMRYADDSDKNSVCYRLKVGEVKNRLKKVTTDAFKVFDLCCDMESGYEEYQILDRMLHNQTENRQLKPAGQISPESLQNPSDEDATFRRKAGKSYQGYVANIVESCGENGNIITNYGYAVNVHADTEFAKEVVDELGSQDEQIVLVTDGAYASEETINTAAGNNIELIPTTLTGKEPQEIITEFEITEDTIETCPEGFEPIDSNYNRRNETYRAHFNKETCERCRRRNECPVKIQKRAAKVELAKKTINRARYIAKLSTEEYKRYARKRNGIEGMPSVLRRRYRVDEMPIRGLVRSKMWFGFKIGAINVKRCDNKDTE